jgi:hypothetical protein
MDVGRFLGLYTIVKEMTGLAIRLREGEEEEEEAARVLGICRPEA